MTIPFFKKTNISNIVKAKGPSPEDQLWAMANDKYWTILNSPLLQKSAGDLKLVARVNALKNALQTYGPTSENLPDFRNNKGKAMGTVFHGHANDSNGTTFVLEWTVVDREKQLIALIGFDSHENYSFRQTPLNKVELDSILACEDNKKAMAQANKKIIEAKQKVARISFNYRHLKP